MFHTNIYVSCLACRFYFSALLLSCLVSWGFQTQWQYYTGPSFYPCDRRAWTMSSWCIAPLYSEFLSCIWQMEGMWLLFDLLYQHSYWWFWIILLDNILILMDRRDFCKTGCSMFLRNAGNVDHLHLVSISKRGLTVTTDQCQSLKPVIAGLWTQCLFSHVFNLWPSNP